MTYLILMFLGILLIITIITYAWYVSIIARLNKTKEALSGIDVQLKQRMDTIPNILFIANKFMDHEKQLLEKITMLREHLNKDYDKSIPADVRNHFAVANELASHMSQLKIAVENYPDLKSNETMVQAMQSYNEIEAKIAAARRFYNAAINEFNNAVLIFPGSLIAKLINVTSLPFYEAEPEDKRPVKAGDYF